VSLTTDPTSACLGHGVDDTPVSQNACYLILSDEERAKGFVHPLRDSYVHVGTPGPAFPLRDLTDEEERLFGENGYVKFEPWPEGFKGSSTGRFWTQAELDAVGEGCGARTRMAHEIAETYARSPRFYGATYCVGCQMHRPVGERGEFVWDSTDERVGT